MNQNNLTTEQSQMASFSNSVLLGAGIGLILISFFLFGAGDPNPEWGRMWMIKPLCMVPIAGAMGGAFYYFMDYLSTRRGLNRTIAVLLSLFVYFIALWMGTVLGLNGTMWD